MSSGIAAGGQNGKSVRRTEHCGARKRQWFSSPTSKTKKYVTGGGNGRGLFVFVQMCSELRRHNQIVRATSGANASMRRLISWGSQSTNWEGDHGSVSLACRLYIAEIILDVSRGSPRRNSLKQINVQSSAYITNEERTTKMLPMLGTSLQLARSSTATHCTAT